MIHSERVEEVYSGKKIPLWLLSAFKAGFLNSAGLLVTGKFVSHVTGFGTQVGVALGHDEYMFGAELLIIPISFILGGVMTSFFLDKNYQTDETPPYWKIQCLITFLIGVVIFMGESGIVKTFIHGAADKTTHADFILISILCFVCGLKNSLVTWSTFGKIRVTHLTGLSTDIGLNLIRTFRPNFPSPRAKEERFVNILRLMTFTFFSTGALISALLFPQVGFKGFFVALFISLGMTIVSINDARKRSLKASSEAFIAPGSAA